MIGEVLNLILNQSIYRMRVCTRGFTTRVLESVSSLMSPWIHILESIKGIYYKIEGVGVVVVIPEFVPHTTPDRPSPYLLLGSVPRTTSHTNYWPENRYQLSVCDLNSAARLLYYCRWRLSYCTVLLLCLAMGKVMVPVSLRLLPASTAFKCTNYH